MIISPQQTRPAYQPKRPNLSTQTVQFSHKTHVHGPDCNHNHSPKAESETQNPIVRFFDAIYKWFKEALTGIWTDFFGKNKEAHQHNEHCDHTAHASNKHPHNH